MNASHSTSKSRALQWAPGLIGLGGLWALVATYSPAEILNEMTQGDWHLLLPLALVMSVIGLFIVSLADTIVVRHGVGPVRYWDLIRGKAGSSVLDVVGYAASHGGYAVWVARFAGTTASAALGVLLVIMASDLAAVCLVACAPIFLADVSVSQTIVAITVGLAVVMVGLLFIPKRTPGVEQTQWRVISRKLPRSRGLLQLGLRITQIVLWVITTTMAAWSFGLQIPLWAMVVYGPLILLAAALPLNVAGFGVAQGAWLLLLDYAPGEQILAFAALWNLALAIAVVLRGLPFLRGVVQEVGGRATTADTVPDSHGNPALLGGDTAPLKAALTLGITEKS